MKQCIAWIKQCYLSVKASVFLVSLATLFLLAIFLISSQVIAEQVAVQPQQAIPTTLDFKRPVQSESISEEFGTSEAFLADTGGIAKPAQDNFETEVKSNIHDGTYDKEKCEEIANGWSCTSFYIGGSKQKEMIHQSYSEGDSAKGSSWATDETREWDKNGNLLKSENLRVQTEWQYDDEKNYKYTQRYRNGILEDEHFSQAVPPSGDTRHGLLIEYGRL